MYDWANSAFVTSVGTAILPIYYANVAATPLPENIRTAYWAYTATVALLLVALVSPVLGAAADFLGAKKRFLGAFVLLGAGASVGLYFVGTGDWLYASVVYVLGYLGFAGSIVFYESLLPHVADGPEIDRVSTAGYAVGYIGGGILLAVNMAWIVMPETFGMSDAGQASRIAFVSVAVWWVLFSVPLLRRVREPAARLEPGEVLELNPVRVGFGRVWATLKEVRRHRQVFLFLLAFWCYNDGIGTIIKMATIYGNEIGIGQTDLIGALILVQFLGIPFTFAFGGLADRIGTKNGI
ncbi:MAG: MFS transporter, partial [Gemmatimonadetes bacterium]|nr:MFS transporter [Gemmatimonadota bacterium]NIR77843.1 MFS transporter [Gemmatimonadota bacterium]NIT86379.1 MFS transporter [Gemmatimonadota bacterium]NIU30216.1 MFS transporter [Gemmatimonadota bacterium]NIU35124.1 MFS transporter [Gemmatimonadota bacterium]